VEGRLAGDSLELSALKGSGWSYDGNRSVAFLPAEGEEGEEKEKAAGDLRIGWRHPFSAALQVWMYGNVWGGWGGGTRGGT
jgi:hypothetical protein